MRVLALCVAAWWCLPVCAAADRTTAPLPCQDLPAAVRKAAAPHKSKIGTEPECEKIVENGRTLYEVKITTAEGRMREIVFHADGRLQEMEDEGDLQSIPPAARASIEKTVASSGGVLRKVDVIRRGSTVLYEGEYRVGQTKRKLIVAADGRTVEAR